MFLFEDGRQVYEKSLLIDDDMGKYLEVIELSEIPIIEGKVGYWVADLFSQQPIVRYSDYTPEPVEPLQPEPVEIYKPTDGELLIMDAQATMYEEMQANRLLQMEANADIYEAILLSKGGVV